MAPADAIARAPAWALGLTAAGCMAVDALFERRGDEMLPLPVAAGLDWSAHAATTALALRALVPAALRERVAVPALVASVLIDADHVPQALDGKIGPGQARPATHHLAVPLVPLAAAAVLPAGRARDRLAGVAIGLSAHFARDLVTGPGVRGIRWPQAAGAAGIGVLAALGALRR